MTTPQGSVTEWQYLANEAKAGRLRFDPDVARDFSDACDKLIARLRRAKRTIQGAGYIDGLGDFSCARQLTPMLQDLAVGSGPNSMTTGLDEYIAVAELMKETVGYSLAETIAQDEHNNHNLHSI